MEKEKILIVYKPFIDDEEKHIFEEAFGVENISYGEYRTRGMEAASFDVQFIINLLNHPYLTAVLNLSSLIIILDSIVNKIFKRNNEKIVDNKSRPRYTVLTFKLVGQSINISNVNNEGRIKISRITADFKLLKQDIELGEQEYSKDKLEQYFKDKPKIT